MYSAFRKIPTLAIKFSVGQRKIEMITSAAAANYSFKSSRLPYIIYENSGFSDDTAKIKL